MSPPVLKIPSLRFLQMEKLAQDFQQLELEHFQQVDRREGSHLWVTLLEVQEAELAAVGMVVVVPYLPHLSLQREKLLPLLLVLVVEIEAVLVPQSGQVRRRNPTSLEQEPEELQLEVQQLEQLHYLKLELLLPSRPKPALQVP